MGEAKVIARECNLSLKYTSATRMKRVLFVILNYGWRVFKTVEFID